MALVKAADKLSAYVKCVEELKGGNTEFKQAAEQIHGKAFVPLDLPELSYFMKECLPAFSLDAGRAGMRETGEKRDKRRERTGAPYEAGKGREETICARLLR
ncbi:MAG: YfbR-like 5'-deoxynucleotidase [Oscillospiraceae bacterium]